jgi:hypothetical protein
MGKIVKIKYKLKEIHPKVFLVTIDNMYDLTMTFCRVQEFYESPYKEIKGKFFNMVEFQRLYTMRKNEECFTYPIDWTGFNIPSNVVEDFFDNFYANFDKHDYNIYDKTFEGIHFDIKNTINEGEDYYIIGSDPKNDDTIKHELSHAFYYLYPNYKKKANKIINKIPKNIFNKIKKTLFDLGYSSKVIKDEIQAYLANDYYTVTQDVNLGGKQKIIIDNIKKELKVLNNKMHK